jgi:nicotinamidase-related amidase
MRRLPPDTALILIDVQRAFDDPSWGKRNNPAAESNVLKLLTAWRHAHLPIIHVHHRNTAVGSLFNPEDPGFQVKQEATPFKGEPVIFKSLNSAFIGTDLQDHLKAMKVNTLVIVGITTDHCVSTTTRMAGNLGFNTHIVSDATATFERVGPDGCQYSAETMHSTALASLNREFATVATTSEILLAIPGNRIN